MKYLLIILLFPLITKANVMDTVPSGVPQLFGGKYYKFNGYILVDSFIMNAAGDTLDIPRFPALKFKASDNRWYVWDRSRWQRLAYFGLDSNFANANLRFTGDRTHSAASHSLTIDSLTRTRFTASDSIEFLAPVTYVKGPKLVFNSTGLGYQQTFEGGFPATGYIVAGTGNWGLNIQRASVSAGSPHLSFYKTRSSNPATMAAPVANDGQGAITWHTVSGNNLSISTSAGIEARIDSVATTYNSGYLQFYTKNRSGFYAERMRLHHQGYLSLVSMDSTASLPNILYHEPSTGIIKKASIALAHDGNGIYSGSGSLPSDITVSTGGFTTTWTGSNDGETSFSVVNNGTTNASAIAGSASGTTSTGVSGTSSQYIGVLGTSTSNNGIQGQSTSGVGVIGTSSTNAALRGQINPVSTDAIENVLTILRTTSTGAGANGIGAAIQYELETATSGNSQTAGRLAFLFTDATQATRTSQFEVYGVDNAVTQKILTGKGAGQIQFNVGYGTNAHTGTPASSAQFDATGNIIEGPVLAAGTYTPTLTGVANVDASTAFSCQYMRVGNAVIVSGRVDIDPTAAGATSLGISLPIASAFANNNEGGGTGSVGTSEGLQGAISADATNDRVQLDFVIPAAGSLANNSWFFSFTYRIL